MRGALVVLLVAALAMAPELAIGLTVSDSYRFNLLWPDQFGAQFRSGDLYPRWLPLSWGGMGSPNFYFYPPLFFWVTSFFDALTLGALAPERFVPLGTMTLLAASGLTMRAWLTVHVAERRALIGAVAYMLAPYHLYDIYARGALAEASAYAVVPLVMLGIARLDGDRRRALPLLALGYGALLLTHLPTALLVSLLLIPPYVVAIAARTARPRPFLVSAAVGGLLGIALAAVYLLPALALLPYVSPAVLSGPFYRPESWFFWHVQAGPMAARMFLIVPVTLAASVLAVGAIRTADRRDEDGPYFWAAMTLFLAVLIAGLIPPIWQLPGLKLVQFPWRALLPLEFTAVTMLTIRLPRLMSPEGIVGGLLLLFSYGVLLLMADHTVSRTWSGQKQTASEIRSGYLDAPEYLPAGTKIVLGLGAEDVSYQLPKVPIASAAAPGATVTATQTADGGMTVFVDSPAATEVTLHRFYFPHWRVEDAHGRAIPVKPKPQERVVVFSAPPGRSVFRLEHGIAPFETIARIVSILAALALAVLVAFSRAGGVSGAK